MYDNFNYPEGADTTLAPWNEKETPEKDFYIDVECGFRKKNVKVTTDDYFQIPDGEEMIADTSCTNWDAVFASNHYTIPELLSILKSYLEVDLKNPRKKAIERAKLKKMLEDCNDWEVYEEIYNES